MRFIEIESLDGQKVRAFECESKTSKAIGNIILLHEIFGVTPYIENVCRYWGARGFNILAPSLFQRVEPDAIIPYSNPELGLSLTNRTNLEQLGFDITAARDYLAQNGGPVCIYGYCWGGGLAYWAATEIDEIDSVAVVYGTKLLEYIHQRPKCRIEYHFGKHDKHTPESTRDLIVKASPGARLHMYNAGHGFDNRSNKEWCLEASELLRSNLEKFFVGDKG